MRRETRRRQYKYGELVYNRIRSGDIYGADIHDGSQGSAGNVDGAVCAESVRYMYISIDRCIAAAVGLRECSMD